MPTTLTCINCPLGCELTVETAADGSVASICGNECARGVQYAKAELVHPERVLTSTVRIVGAGITMLPVKTAAPIPKGMVEATARALADIEVTAPVHAGDIVLADCCGLGVDVVATRTLLREDAVF